MLATLTERKALFLKRSLMMDIVSPFSRLAGFAMTRSLLEKKARMSIPSAMAATTATPMMMGVYCITSISRPVSGFLPTVS